MNYNSDEEEGNDDLMYALKKAYENNEESNENIVQGYQRYVRSFHISNHKKRNQQDVLDDNEDDIYNIIKKNYESQQSENKVEQQNEPVIIRPSITSYEQPNNKSPLEIKNEISDTLLWKQQNEELRQKNDELKNQIELLKLAHDRAISEMKSQLLKEIRELKLKTTNLN